MNGVVFQSRAAEEESLPLEAFGSQHSAFGT